MKIINWFTKHFDKEIGALGIGEMTDGELFIEKLVFPKQIVNGGHVHFKPKDWAPIIKELTPEELGKIVFYWHKHPTGNPSASAGDEEDTFDVFMDENAERPFFGFLQTAPNHAGDGYTYEARIEMRKPIWASITNTQIITDADTEIEEECKKIIKERVISGNAAATDQPGFYKNGIKINTGYGVLKKDNTSYGSFGKDKVITASHQQVDDYDAKFSPEMKNGCIKLHISPYFEEWVVQILEDPEIAPKIAKQDIDYESDGETVITLQPKKKQGGFLYKFFVDMEKEYFEEEYDKLEDKMGVDHYTEEADIKASQQRHTKSNYFGHSGYTEDNYGGFGR